MKMLAVVRKERIKSAGNMRIPTRQRKWAAGVTLHLFLASALLFQCGISTVSAKPRPLAPPWPEFGLLMREGFDQPYGFPTNQTIDSSIWRESWTGWAMNRQGVAVTPWAVPMVVSNAFRIEPERGAIRFWYRPDFSSGSGPGNTATLLELATSNGKTEAVWWALVVSPEGNEVHLVCQTEKGAESCLSSKVDWEAGSWHMLTLGFTPTNSALFIDDQIAAVGDGLATIPKEIASITYLIIGSTLAGESPAQGQIEELSVFSGRKKMQQIMGNPFGLSVDWEIGLYYASLSKTAALGPISDEEIAARKALAEKRKAERLALGLDDEGGSGGGMMRLMSGPVSACVTNSPLFITNAACFYDTNAGWTLQFDVQGTNGPADIFTISALGTTNAWTWLERGPTCSRYEYTNMPPEQSYVILGTLLDTDGDLLTDAYERLVSHTNPNVPDAPAILFQPLSQTVEQGDTVTFTVIADGAQPLTYQWLRGGTNIIGETNTSLTLSAVDPAQADDYSVLVTSPAALSTLSSNATLTVQTPANWPLVTLAGSRQDYTFKNGITYYVGSRVELYGTTTIEGGAVIKPDYYYPDSTLAVMGKLICKTEDAYFPAFFTSVDDDTIGDAFQFSSGIPTAISNGAPYLDLTFAQDASPALNNLRIRYADQGVSTPKNKRLNVWNSQFVECNAGLVANKDTTISLHNALFGACGAVVAGATNFTAIEAEHVTADATNFWTQVAPSQIKLTNSFIIGTLGSGPTLVTDHTVVNPSGAVFQPSGSGRYYLTNTSSYVRAGTTNVSPRLLTEFRQKTTQAPLIFPEMLEIAGDMTLGQQVARYTNGAPDYGYYYPPLDYTVAWLTLRGKMIILPGAAVGFRNEYSTNYSRYNWWGFDLREGSSFVSQGTPSRPNVFTDIQMVQEQLASPCLASFMPSFFPNDSGNIAPSMDFRFSRFYANANWYHVWAGYEETCNFLQSPDSLVDWSLRDCELRGGRVNLGPPDDGFFYGAPMDWYYGACSVSWVNNLFDTVAVTLNPTFYWYNGATNCDMTFSAQNNLFRGGQWFFLSPVPASGGNWTLTDNLFDKVTFAQDTFAPLDFHHNGYWPLTSGEAQWADAEWLQYHGNDWYGYPYALATTNQLQMATNASGGNEQFLTVAPPYQTGPLGNFYLPTTTQLYHAGSTAVTNTALYQFTTQADQTKAGNEYPSGHNASIGLHYVATTNANSIFAKDSDGDGISDFVEDVNGNGAVDASETSPVLTQTVSGVHDSTNSIYDDIDLSGNGLVGRIKKALGLSPLITSTPLTLNPIAFDNEWGIATYELPISYSVLTNIGGLNLNLNGINVKLEDIGSSTNGNCVINWNSTYDSFGLRFLQIKLTLNAANDYYTEKLTAYGSLLPYYSSNPVQFFESDSIFDDTSAFLDAQLPAQNADYVISLYDASTTPPSFLTAVTNSTSNGIIQEDWDLTYNGGMNVFTGAQLNAVFDVELPGQSGGGPAQKQRTKRLNRIRTRECISGDCMDGFNVVYFKTCTNNAMDSIFYHGSIWYGMQGVVDILTMPSWPWEVYYSYFNVFGYPTIFAGYPGYVTARSNSVNSVWGGLYPDLGNGTTKNLYAYGHGNADYLGTFAPDVYIKAREVTNVLANTYATKGGLVPTNPYRFVFLDGCSTASGLDWRRAFGIMPYSATNQAARFKLGPQAFVGWAGLKSDHFGGRYDTNGAIVLQSSEVVATAYTETLQQFFLDWMNGASLAQCIRNASNTNLIECPLPVPGITNFTVNGTSFSLKYPSKIYVVGHSGLTVTGLITADDNKFVSPIDQ
jgi:hypothetical protein